MLLLCLGYLQIYTSQISNWYIPDSVSLALLAYVYKSDRNEFNFLKKIEHSNTLTMSGHISPPYYNHLRSWLITWELIQSNATLSLLVEKFCIEYYNGGKLHKKFYFNSLNDHDIDSAFN